MTFKSINGLVLNKIQTIKNKKASEDILLDIFKTFLVDMYGEQTASRLFFSLGYNHLNRRLVIVTKSKVFASDLILRLDKLSGYLSKKTKNIKEIVIK